MKSDFKNASSFPLGRLLHSSKEFMTEVDNLRAEKMAVEESSKLATKKFQQELGQLRAQIESLQSQVSFLTRPLPPNILNLDIGFGKFLFAGPDRSRADHNGSRIEKQA